MKKETKSSEITRDTLCDTNNPELFDNLIMQHEWMTACEAANYLKISKSSLYNMCSAGKLNYYKMDDQRRSRFLRRDLDLLLLKNKRGPQ